jgi:hypothetical protein
MGQRLATRASTMTTFWRSAPEEPVTALAVFRTLSLYELDLR